MATNKTSTPASASFARASNDADDAHSPEQRAGTATTPATASTTPPTGLMRLLSLATQHRVGWSSRRHGRSSSIVHDGSNDVGSDDNGDGGSDGRPNFLLTVPLPGRRGDDSGDNGNRRQVLRMRAARAGDLDAVAAMARRSGATTAFDLAAQPGQHRYPGDYARALYWNWSAWFHYRSSVVLVAELADELADEPSTGDGRGDDNGKNGKDGGEIVAVLGINWRGKARKGDEAAGESSFARINNVQIGPLLREHLSSLGNRLAHRLDRSRSRSQTRALDGAQLQLAPTSETPGFDAEGAGVDAAAGGFDTQPDLWYCYDLVVDPAHNGRGVGGRLLGLATAAVGARDGSSSGGSGGETFILTAAPGTHGFYAKQGFVRFGASVVGGDERVEMYHRRD